MSDSSIDTALRQPALLPAWWDGRNGLVWCAAAVFAFSLTLVATRAAVPELGGAFVGAARSVLAGILAALVLAFRRQAFPRGAVLRLWLVAQSLS
jgi:hypothetical protein